MDYIISTMSDDDKEKLGVDKDGYISYDQGFSVVKRVLHKDGDTPVAFFDVLDDGDTYNLVVGTNPDYRGKGYASKVAKQGMDYVEKNWERLGNKSVVCGVKVDNILSIKIAKGLGFEIDPDSYSDDKRWVNYVKKRKIQKEV